MTRRSSTAPFIAWVAVSCTGPQGRHAAAPVSGEVARPPHRAHHAITYDPATRRVVLYGGSQWTGGSNIAVLDDLWSWDGARWTMLASTGSGMLGHRLFADGTGGVFFVGGSKGRTARWDSNRWVTVAEDSGMKRSGTAAAWDSHRRRFVLFGGRFDATGVIAGDTWEFDGQRWLLLATTGPPASVDATMAYDDRRRVMVLFSGRSGTGRGEPHGETWEWSGTAWSKVSTNGPSPRSYAGMAYDSRRRATLLFGGVDSLGTLLNDTWTWNGREWQRIEGPAPSPRQEPLMAYDASRHAIVMFGGATNSAPTLGDTWEWNGTWRQVLR